jgi:hypothetical protein
MGTYYFKLEADLSVYDGSKPTNLLYYQTVGESYYEINLLSVIVVTVVNNFNSFLSSFIKVSSDYSSNTKGSTIS